MAHNANETIEIFTLPNRSPNGTYNENTKLRRVTTGHGDNVTVEWQRENAQYIFIEGSVSDAIEEINRISTDLIDPVLEYRMVDWSEQRVLHIVGWETGVSPYDIKQALQKSFEDAERRDRDIKARADRDKAEVARIKVEHPEWF
jgi:hypothetical protein